MPEMADFPRSSVALRRELSLRNQARAGECPHEISFGAVPAILYQCDDQGLHGNFLPAAYRRICANPEWRRRLDKSYSGGRWIVRSWERSRRELDCSNSSDALLMNVFCYPGVLQRSVVCAMLGIDRGVLPDFGFRPRLPVTRTKSDQTELDMRLGSLFVEAKLTESGSPSAPAHLVLRYRDLDEIFDTNLLPRDGSRFLSYQLIRGVLAAYAHNASYLLLCDSRGSDWTGRWFQIVSAVRGAELRTRLKLLTWQELASALPQQLRRFLDQKFGIRSF